MTDLTNTAPKRIYLDIGDQFALERVMSGGLSWQALEGVTWSEDNATSHGIPYVRADLVPTPAASGAAPADVPYDDCLNNLGWKMNDFLMSNGAIFDGHVFNNMKGFLRDCIMEWLAAHPSALASPQVAPAKVYLVATGEVVDGMETYTRHEGAPPPLCDSELLFATPVQVAPAVPEALYGVGNDQINWPLVGALIEAHMTASRYHSPGTSNWGAWLYKSIVKAAREAAPAPVAPQDDARDAAEVLTDEQINAMAIARYTVVPKPYTGFRYGVKVGDGESFCYEGHRSECETVAARMRTAFLDGAYVARDPEAVLSTRAAKPTEPTLTTQGEQSHD